MLTYSQRSNLASHPLASRLLRLMDEKQSNLCVAADVTAKKDLLKIADELGKEICVLKTHIDIIKDFDNDLIVQLCRLAEKHDFLIFEDRKFADIGNTVKEQYGGGLCHIADWAHITNAHALPGPGIIDGIKEVGLPKNRGLLLLAQMSSKGALTNDNYAAKTVEMALANKDFVIGFIAQKRLTDEPGFITMTPGVQLTTGADNLGQQYNTPELVIEKQKSDIVIVGRGIYGAADPVGEAKKYRAAGWRAYRNTLL